MIKKSGTKTKPKVKKSSKDKELERLLVNNFVTLQKVMVNLSIKFDELTNQISKLLELFQTSAKVLAEKDFDAEKNTKETAKILEKLETVLDQNRTIAKGLTLMHDKINDQPSNTNTSTPQGYYPQQSNQLNQRYPLQQISPLKPGLRTSSIGGVSEEYHKPISPNEQ